MIKSKHFIWIILAGLIMAIGFCRKADKPAVNSESAEILPEDIVELRDDQIKLADIGLGKIEMRSLGNIIKVNGIISVAPKEPCNSLHANGRICQIHFPCAG